MTAGPADDGRVLAGAAILLVLGAGVAHGSRADAEDPRERLVPSRQGDLFSGFDRPGFTWYVVLEGRILAGWERRDDARDYVTEDLHDRTASAAVILDRRGLARRGIDPAKTAAWWG